MNNDTIFRQLLCWLAAAAVLAGIYTHSYKKTAATYIFGMFAICGVLLPDWEQFDRPISQWFTPVILHHNSLRESRLKQLTPARFRLYPARMIVYAIVYSFAFYKWRVFIIST